MTERIELKFAERFVYYVEHGIKRQSIRKATVAAMAGDTVRLFTAVGERYIGDATVQRVAPVRLDGTEMFFNGQRLHSGDALRGETDDRDNDFAKKEGFDGYMEMADWFAEHYGELPFDGVVIFWGDIR